MSGRLRWKRNSATRTNLNPKPSADYKSVGIFPMEIVVTHIPTSINQSIYSKQKDQTGTFIAVKYTTFNEVFSPTPFQSQSQAGVLFPFQWDSLGFPSLLEIPFPRSSLMYTQV